MVAEMIKDMPIDVVIMAGGVVPDSLKGFTGKKSKAMLKIGDRYMVEYVVDAVRGMKGVGKVICVGHEDEIGQVLGGRVDVMVPSVDSMMENLRAGLRAVAGTDLVLICTCDIPLITSAVLEDFIRTCKKRQTDLCYPIVEKAVNERLFPSVKRTYVRLKDGVFTGGNVVLVNPTVFEAHWALIERAMALRKSPLKLLRMLGIFFVLRFIFRQLSIANIESKVEKILGFHAAAVIVPHPEIGIDVDKESDYKIILEALTKK
ncbi:MAG: nucleotidyltransferase family protein [bacterium]